MNRSDLFLSSPLRKFYKRMYDMFQYVGELTVELVNKVKNIVDLLIQSLQREISSIGVSGNEFIMLKKFALRLCFMNNFQRYTVEW
jgi:hypothetical protein